MASMPAIVDDRVWIRAFQLWIVSTSVAVDCRHEQHTTHSTLVTRRHRQDRPPRGRRPPAPRGSPVRVGSRSGAAARSTGTTARPGRRALRRRDGGVRLLLPRHRRARRGRRPSARSPSRPPRPACGGSCCSPAAASRRRSAPSSAVQAPAPTATILRCSWFAQNFSESFLLEPVLAGEVALPVDDVPEPFVDAEDIADVAVAALTEDGHAGQRLRAHRPAAADVRRGRRRDRAGRRPRGPLRALTRRGLRGRDAPSSGVPRGGRRARSRTCSARCSTAATRRLTDGVQRALGREPRDFADYARRTAATGVWGVHADDADVPLRSTLATASAAASSAACSSPSRSS